MPAACYMRAPRPHGCGAWICARLREHPRGEAPLGLYRICFNSAPTPRRPSARFSPHAELRRPRILRVGGRLVMSLSFVFRKCLRGSRKGQKGENGACRTSAKAPKEKMELAELLQKPQRGKWSLQNFCKRPKGENGACRTSANAPKEKMELAELLQMPQRGKRSLQNFCKRPKGENGACRTSANVPKGKMELAELLQMPQRGKWSLQNFCERLPIHSYITPHT